MGGDWTVTKRAISRDHGIPEDSIVHGICKAAFAHLPCVVLPETPQIHRPHPKGDLHKHMGAVCRGAFLCLACGHEWHTNSRAASGAGSANDMNDPSVRLVLDPAPLAEPDPILAPHVAAFVDEVMAVVRGEKPHRKRITAAEFLT